MDELIIGYTYFNDKNEYVRVTEIFEDGTHAYEIIEMAYDYQYDIIVRDIPQEYITVKPSVLDYPHEEINRMSGY